jgi:hypothetical protein
VTVLAFLKPVWQPDVAAAECADERPQDAQADGHIHRAGLLALDVDAGTIVATDLRQAGGAGRHEILDHSQPRQVFSLTVHQLERLSRRARKAKDAEPEAAQERDRLVRS